MQTLMLNSCNVIRPFVVAVGMIGALWILVPDLFPDLWAYLAAAGVLIVPWMVYRWWNARYNPGLRCPLPRAGDGCVRWK